MTTTQRPRWMVYAERVAWSLMAAAVVTSVIAILVMLWPVLWPG